MSVDGSRITVQVSQAQTLSPVAGVTVAVSPSVFLTADMSGSPVSSVTSNGLGQVVCYALPGTYTFTPGSGYLAIDPQTVDDTLGGGLTATDEAALTALLAQKAPLASPVFTGNPTAPTPSPGDSDTSIATTGFVTPAVAAAVAALVASAPSTLDTLNELATALGDDPNFATTMATTLAGKVPNPAAGLDGHPVAWNNGTKTFVDAADALGFLVPAPTGNATTDTANINAALTAAAAVNGHVRLRYGTYKWNGGVLDVPNGVGFTGLGGAKLHPLTVIQGQGSGDQVRAGNTTDNRGGKVGNFQIDGNSAATNPFKVGLSVQRYFEPITVINSAGIGCLIAGAQNCTFASLDCEDNAGPGLVFDLGAGGNVILRHENNNNGSAGDSSLKFVQTGTSPGAAYPNGPTNNTIVRVITERPASGSTGLVYHGAGENNYVGLNASATSVTSAYTMVHVAQDNVSNPSRNFVIDNPLIQGDAGSLYVTFARVDANCTLESRGGRAINMLQIWQPMATSAQITEAPAMLLFNVSHYFDPAQSANAGVIRARFNATVDANVTSGAFAFTGRRQTDTGFRWTLDSDGTYQVGPGDGTFDAGFSRPSAKVLRLMAGSDFDGLPWHMKLPVESGLATNTNWSTVSADGNTWGNVIRSSTGAQNASATFTVTLTAGTWSLELIHVQNTDRGIYTVAVDGVSIGTIDGYAASLTYNRRDSIVGFTVAQTGKHTVSLTMATKNASSTNYKGTVTACNLLRTA